MNNHYIRTTLILLLLFLEFRYTVAQSDVTLGGQSIEGTLRLTMKATGQVQVARYVNSAWQDQFYGNANVSRGFQVRANGIKYKGGYYDGTQLSAVSNTLNGDESVTVLQHSGIVNVVQTITYASGSAELSIKWEITNVSGATINDWRLFAGGDTYLSGGDAGSGFWDAANNIVGVQKFVDPPTNSQQQNLFFQGVGLSVPFSYSSTAYNSVTKEVQNGALTKEINPNPKTDNGFGLEWRKSSLTAGETWTINSNEKFVTKLITDLSVSAPLGQKVKPGESVDLTFAVIKDNSAATSTTFTASIDQSGWTAVIQSPASPTTLNPNAKQNVVVRVTAPGGAALGSNAKVTLNATNTRGTASDFSSVLAAQIPTISAQPADVFQCATGATNFSVTATNVDTYQWQEFVTGWNSLSDGGAYSGSTTATLGITTSDNSLNGRKYRCILINAFGQIQTQETLLEVDPFSISTQPSNASACDGDADVKISVVATGGGTRSYQWKKGGVNVTGETSSEISITAAQASSGSYTCTISSSGGCSDLTTSASTVIISPLPVTQAPADFTDCEGDMITLSEQSGDAAGYVWDNGVTDGVAFAATKTTTYTVTGTTGGCSSADQVTVTVNTSPVVHGGPDQKLCAGSMATLAGSGTTGTTYSWDNSVTDNVAFTPANGSNINYTVTGTVTATGCMSTDIVNITVNTPVTSSIDDKMICEGQNVNLTNTAGGGTSSYIYSWAEVGGTVIGGETASILNVSPTTTTQYIGYVRDDFAPSSGHCEQHTTATVTVNPAIKIALTDTTICNGSAAELRARPTGGNGTYTYSWSPDSETTQDISTSPGTTTMYSVTVSDNFASDVAACSTTSNNATITVNALPTIGITASDTNPCERESITLSGTGGVKYTWDNSVTDAVAFVPAATGMTTYNITGTDANGCVNTNSQVVDVKAIVEATVGSDVTECSSSYTLTGNDPSPGTGLWTVAVAGPTFGDNSVFNTTASNLNAGLNTFTWTISQNGCTSDATLLVSRDTPLTDFAGDDFDVTCDATSAILDAAIVGGGGTGTWTTSGGATITSPTDRQSGVTNLDEGANIFTWTVDNMNVCADGVDQVTVTRYVTETANAGVDNAICSTSGGVVILAASPISKGSAGWTSNDTNISWNDNSSATAQASGLSFGTNELIWTVTNGNCVSTDMMEVTIENLFTANAGSDVPVCDNTTVGLAATHVPVSGVWTASDAGVTFDDASLHNATASNLTEGITTFTWTLDNGACGNVIDQMTVRRDVNITAIAGSDDIVCGGTSYELSSTAPAKGTAVWTAFDPAVLIDVPSSTTANISNISSAVSMMWSVTNGVCYDSDVVNITLNPLPNVSAGPSVAICDEEEITLAGSGATQLFWDNSVKDNVAFVPTETKTYTLTGTDDAGCVNTSTTVVTVKPNPVVVGGIDQGICIGESVTLAASGADTYLWDTGAGNGEAFSPTVTTTYNVTGFTDGCQGVDQVAVAVNSLPVLSAVPSYPSVCGNVEIFELDGEIPEGGVFSGNGINPLQQFDASFAGFGTHTITYTITDAITSCQNSSTFEMIVDPVPSVTLTGEAITCINTEATFMGEGAVDYKWAGDSLNTQSITLDLPAGFYDIIVTGHDALGCANDALLATEVEALQNAGEDGNVILEANMGTLLDLLSSLGGTPDLDGFWLDDDDVGVNVFDGSSVDFFGVQTGIYGFTYVADGQACANDSSDLQVKVQYLKEGEQVSVSQGFSPNGDGVNDNWFIGEIVDFPLNEVKIINRWGGIVFETTNYNNETNAFSGQSNVGHLGSKNLPEGTYFYVIDLKNGTDAVTGHLSILR